MNTFIVSTLVNQAGGGGGAETYSTGRGGGHAAEELAFCLEEQHCEESKHKNVIDIS